MRICLDSEMKKISIPGQVLNTVAIAILLVCNRDSRSSLDEENVTIIANKRQEIFQQIIFTTEIMIDVLYVENTTCSEHVIWWPSR